MGGVTPPHRPTGQICVAGVDAYHLSVLRADKYPSILYNRLESNGGIESVAFFQFSGVGFVLFNVAIERGHNDIFIHGYRGGGQESGAC